LNAHIRKTEHREISPFIDVRGFEIRL